MEYMISKLEYYRPSSEKYRTQKQVHFLVEMNFTKEEKWFLLHLKIVYFHCLNIIHQRVVEIDSSELLAKESDTITIISA